MTKTELSVRILNSLKTQGQYLYSQDASIKLLENQIVDELEQNGSIRITARAIGMVIATVR